MKLATSLLLAAALICNAVFEYNLESLIREHIEHTSSAPLVPLAACMAYDNKTGLWNRMRQP